MTTDKAVSEKRFIQDCKAYDKVYDDIISICPAIGLYHKNTNFYSHYVCHCVTTKGEVVRVYIPASYYKQYFDEDASTSVSLDPDYREVSFISAKRIHGTAVLADSIMSGLSNDTGVNMIIRFNSIADN